jgi:starch-binding outer membrane protein, SusD/RagB family
MMKPCTINYILLIKSTPLMVCCLIFTSCNNFLEVELSPTSITQQLVFTDEVAATSAVKGMYAEMLPFNSFASGSTSSAAFVASLSADEIIYKGTDADLQQFEGNTIDPASWRILNIWRSAYKTIYQANSIMEGLRASTIAMATKDQLMGEALFVRALAYFYLVNLFGDVPLAITTNYVQNAELPRTPAATVYDQITADLQRAEQLLPDVYAETGRQRPNKAAAQSLRASVHLYRQQWQDAIDAASQVISNRQYAIAPNLNDVFLAGNTEAIWQLAFPPDPYITTYEGATFVIKTTNDVAFEITDGLLNSFEPNDLRMSQWVGVFDSGTEKFYFPYKYRQKGGSATPTEHSTRLRLAELYLIRAEAHAQQNKLNAAIADLDTIRKRAGLTAIADTNPLISQDALLQAIQEERRHELFTEGAHRWFDLKRTNPTIETLKRFKPVISIEDLLYPLPETELSDNPNLKNQNPGY